MVIDKVKKVNKEEKRIKNEKASDMLIGKWVKCDVCKEIIYKEELHKNLSVCPNCGKHFRLSARRRISQIVDENTFQEIGANIQTKNPLNFEGYTKKIETLTYIIYEMAGENFNINSTKQLGEILFEKLKLPVIKKTLR